MQHLGVCGQLNVTVNMKTVYSVVEWKGDSDKRQEVIYILHSKLQFPSKVCSMCYFCNQSSKPTVTGTLLNGSIHN